MNTVISHRHQWQNRNRPSRGGGSGWNPAAGPAGRRGSPRGRGAAARFKSPVYPVSLSLSLALSLALSLPLPPSLALSSLSKRAARTRRRHLRAQPKRESEERRERERARTRGADPDQALRHVEDPAGPPPRPAGPSGPGQSVPAAKRHAVPAAGGYAARVIRVAGPGLPPARGKSPCAAAGSGARLRGPCSVSWHACTFRGGFLRPATRP